MKVLNNWTSGHLIGGHLTLQVPWHVIVPEPEEDEETLDAPESWFWKLNCGRPAVGREHGFLYVSPDGYSANRHTLFAAYKSGVEKIGGRGYGGKNATVFCGVDEKYVVENPLGYQHLELTQEAFDAWAECHFKLVKLKLLGRILQKSTPQGHVPLLEAELSKWFPLEEES